MRSVFSVVGLILALLIKNSTSFNFHQRKCTHSSKLFSFQETYQLKINQRTKLWASVEAVESSSKPIIYRDPEEWIKCGPYLSIGKQKINLHGALFLVMSCFIFAPIWLLGLNLVRIQAMIRGKDWDPNLVQYDNISKWWARTVLSVGRCYPSIEGWDNLPPASEAVMFVANHTSWFDIVAICLIMVHNSESRAFKYVSKDELLKIPVMGTSLKLGGHVMLAREDRASQIATFKAGVKWLKDRVSLITFAEGTRSKNGVLGRFKRGAFKMAMQSNVRIVPVSLVGMHRTFPSWAVMPICPGEQFMKVVIHKPIQTEGRSEEDISKETYEAINAGLPVEQKSRSIANPSP